MKKLLFILALFVSVHCCNGTTLDWNSVNWTAGSLNNGFDIDGTNPGNDITIAISGDVLRIDSGFPVDSNTPFTGGTTDQYLQLRMDFQNDTQQLYFSIDFNYVNGVDSVEIVLHDVDRSNNAYIDKLSSITGTSVSNTTVNATITTSVNNTLTDPTTVTGTGLASDTSNTGDVVIKFFEPIKNISFYFGNDSAAQNNPSNNQGFSIGSISYSTSVPEPSTYMMLVVALVMMFFYFSRPAKR